MATTTTTTTPSPNLIDIYNSYISLVNSHDVSTIGSLVSDTVVFNDQPLGLSGYISMINDLADAIPDTHIKVEHLTVDQTHIAARLSFDCTPKGEFLGLPVNGKRVQFTEHAFYRVENGKIQEVWGIIDKLAIEKQLQ